MIYLAGPFWHDQPEIRAERQRIHETVAAELMARGIVVFSPIAYTGFLKSYGVEKPNEAWVDFDMNFLAMCHTVYVLKIEGWKQSKGTKREIEYAKRAGKLITYLEPEQVQALLAARAPVMRPLEQLYREQLAKSIITPNDARREHNPFSLADFVVGQPGGDS